MSDGDRRGTRHAEKIPSNKGWLTSPAIPSAVGNDVVEAD
jgi:hypothetical protein